jgi:ATP-binding protein involved in chromosome partitioning
MPQSAAALEELIVATVRRIDEPASDDPIEVELSTIDLDVSIVLKHALPRRLAMETLHGELEKVVCDAGFVLRKLENGLDVSSRTVSLSDPVPQVKNIILVMSGKGGVGKSTVCANLACAMAAMGAKVGLLDADIYGPSVPTLFGVRSQPVSDGQKIQPLEKHGVKLMSIGFLLESDKSAVIWRGPMLHGTLMQFFNDVAWNELDYLFLDMPPGTGDIALSLSQKIQSNGAVIVTTPQEMALQDVYKAVAMNAKVGIPVLGVVENQSYFVCNGCSTRHELFGKGGGQRVADEAGVPLLGQLPLVPEVQRASDAGLPVVKSDPNSSGALAFFELAERLGQRISKENAGQAEELLIDRSGGKNRYLPIAR